MLPRWFVPPRRISAALQPRLCAMVQGANAEDELYVLDIDPALAGSELRRIHPGI